MIPSSSSFSSSSLPVSQRFQRASTVGRYESQQQLVASGKSFALPNRRARNGDEKLREEEEIPKVISSKEYWYQRRTMLLALIGLVIYYIVGIISFMKIVESWNFTDAVYFITVTITTVGFGFISPTNHRSRMFTIFYAFFGMSLVALCFVELANLALEAREKLKRSMRAGAVDAASSYITQQAHEIRHTGSDSSTRLSRLHRTSRTACSSGYCRKFQERRPITVTILSVTIFILCFGAIFHAVEKGHNDMHFSDSVYFAMISATTIGYGDYYPTSATSKWCIICLLPPSVLFMSWSLKSVAFHILGDLEEEQRRSKMLHANLSLETLLELVDRREIGNDGVLNEFEYIRFMLVRSGLVPAETIQALHENFNMLDADGSGDLTKEDLRLIYAASIDRKKTSRLDCEQQTTQHSGDNYSRKDNCSGGRGGDPEMPPVIQPSSHGMGHLKLKVTENDPQKPETCLSASGTSI